MLYIRLGLGREVQSMLSSNCYRYIGHEKVLLSNIVLTLLFDLFCTYKIC